MEDVAVMLLYARHTLKDHHHCTPFRANVDGLERGIQN
jgi:hypothetical protein